MLLLFLFFSISNSETISCHSSKGSFQIQLYPEWSPIGAERFLNLVRDEFFTDIAIFRGVENFLIQFGISDNPQKKHWHHETIQDDLNLHVRFKKYFLSFAGAILFYLKC